MGISVVLAEDNLIVREGIVGLLADHDAGIDVLAACGDMGSLLDTVDALEPDVVVTDIRMPPTGTDEGLRIGTILRERHPRIGVVILSSYAEPAYAMHLVQSGLEGRAYVLKERVHDRSQLISAVHAVAAGGSVMDSRVVEPLVAANRQAPPSRLGELTPRERRVLSEIAQGKSNAAIAESLVLTKRAVEKHINAIFLKLDLGYAQDVSKRVKATLLFLAEEGEPRAGVADGTPQGIPRG